MIGLHLPEDTGIALYWKAPHKWKVRLETANGREIKGKMDEIWLSANNDVARFLSYIVPDSFVERFGTRDAVVSDEHSFWSDGPFVLRWKGRDPWDSLTLTFDKNYLPIKKETTGFNGTDIVERMEYAFNAGTPLLKKVSREIHDDGGNRSNVTELEYVWVNGFWLPSRITEYLQIHSFDHYRVNQGIDDSVFTKQVSAR